MRQENGGVPLSDTPLATMLMELGEARGEAKGCARILLRQMTVRFGPPSEQAESRIRSATIEQLERGTDAILTAQRIEDVLEAVG